MSGRSRKARKMIARAAIEEKKVLLLEII